MASNIIERWKA